jgi:hypothetical protein
MFFQIFGLTNRNVVGAMYFDFRHFQETKIPKADEEFDKDSDMGKKMLNAIDLNKVAYTERLLSIDVKTSNGKVAFIIVKGCKSKDYPDGNVTIAWDKLKNKYEPMSAPSIVKLDKQFRDTVLKKGEDPED